MWGLGVEGFKARRYAAEFQWQGSCRACAQNLPLQPIFADIRLVACVGSIKVLEKLCRTSSGFKPFGFQGGGVRDSGSQSFSVQG